MTVIKNKTQDTYFLYLQPFDFYTIHKSYFDFLLNRILKNIVMRLNIFFKFNLYIIEIYQFKKYIDMPHIFKSVISKKNT